MRASGYDRVVRDFYTEPRWIVDALLDVEDFPGLSWDPSCGSGNIPEALNARGLVCRGSDIVDRGYGTVGLDFFTAPGLAALDDQADNIVSNPPYANLEVYVRRALTLVRGKVAVLARLAFLEGQARQAMFREIPPKKVWVSSRRVSIPPGGSGIKATGGTVAYAWFVWQKGYVGEPTIGWV